jgi:hypothetical protein
MFALCHYKESTYKFVLFDKKEIKEVADHLNIEIEKTMDFEEFDKNYNKIPLLCLDDLVVRSISNKTRTNTHVLSELGISTWTEVKNEYNLIQEKKSKFSHSERKRIEDHYQLICSM